MQLTALIYFPNRFCSHPYWPERERLINITKMSGTNRARSEAKRIESLKNFLAGAGMTMEEFEELQAKADRQFYQVKDLPVAERGDHDPEEIIIPSHQWYGCLANATALATSSIRISTIEQVRTVLNVGNLYTGKTRRDGVWDRFVTVKTGTGAKLSNQRSLRSNDYIENFSGELVFTFSEDVVKTEKIKTFVEFAGRQVGVGASRKLNLGRFQVKEWN